MRLEDLLILYNYVREKKSNLMVGKEEERFLFEREANKDDCKAVFLIYESYLTLSF